MGQSDNIALFDMDGTLCDYDKGLFDGLEKLRSTNEPPYHPPVTRNSPLYIQNRADVIRSSEAWWENLPVFNLGWDVLNIARELEFRIMILTQGPVGFPDAWSGKKRWIDKHLGAGTEVTITRDKSLVYGKIFVDDFPGYIDGWLKWRKNGRVIMPANESNKDYKHPKVIRYGGANLQEVRAAMQSVLVR